MKEWNEYKEILSEVEDFQKKMAALNDKSKKRLLTKGRQANTSPYTIKPSLARSKSAPPGFGAMGESEVDLVPEIQDDLNRDIWGEDNKLNPEISEKLLRIAKDFYEKLDLPTPILDITFTGSMANYNWTSLSDIDLHIVVDYLAINENQELVRNYLMEAKSNWNRNHDIRIKGHEVEIYVQDSNEPHHSTAVYSVLNDDWLIKPRKKRFEASEDAIRQKADAFIARIDLLQKLSDEGKHEEVYGDSERLRDKLRNYRQSGLETGGEFSTENLVFKFLRNSEELKKSMT
jgi:predicted nucleotidyltransferase